MIKFLWCALWGIHMHKWPKFGAPYDLPVVETVTEREVFTGTLDEDNDPIYYTEQLETPIVREWVETFQQRTCATCGLTEARSARNCYVPATV